MIKYIALVLLLGCAPYENVGEFKTVLLDQGDTIVEVGAALGNHSRYKAEYRFVFKVDGDGNALCEIVVLEFGKPLEFITVIIDGPTKKTVWGDVVFHGSRVPDLNWSARLK